MINHVKVITAAIALALLAVVTILWSWNTLAALFDGPEMQAKHDRGPIVTGRCSNSPVSDSPGTPISKDTPS